MAYCSKCTAQVKEDERYCPNCGAPVAQQPCANPGEQATEAKGFTAKIAGLNDTADTTAAYAGQDVASNKAMAVLAYLGPLVFVPIFAAKESKFARFHANQGLLLLIADVAYGIVQAVVTSIFWAINWRLGSIMSTVLGLVWILFTIAALIGILNAANGKAKELPLIGKMRILK